MTQTCLIAHVPGYMHAQVALDVLAEQQAARERAAGEGTHRWVR